MPGCPQRSTINRLAGLALLVMAGLAGGDATQAATSRRVLEKYEWLPVDGAKYYRGEFRVDGKMVKFRTTGVLVYLPPGGWLEVRGIEYGILLDYPEIIDRTGTAEEEIVMIPIAETEAD